MDNVSKDKVMLAVEAGVDEMLVKPFTQGDIIPKMRAAFKVFNNPKNPERVYEHAKSMLKQQKFDEAIAAYTILEEVAPKAARPSVGLARVKLAQNKIEEALKHLQDAETKNANYVHLYGVRGQIYCQTQQWDESFQAFQKAIELSPLNPVRYQSAAEILFKVNRYQDAQTLLQKAIKHDLEFPSLHHFLSQACFALKDFPGALKSIRHALSKSADNVTYLNQLGICLKETGELEEANKTYNRIIKIDPENMAALYNKAVLMKSRGDNQEAMRLLEKILKKNPNFKPAKIKYDECKKALGSAA
jgi:tetratricopeptide (TPR) repeat protein